jgi:hypothetical protein
MTILIIFVILMAVVFIVLKEILSPDIFNGEEESNQVTIQLQKERLFNEPSRT